MAYYRTYDNVKEFIEITSQSGCTLLSLAEEYSTLETELKIKCRCGDIFFTNFHRFIRLQKHGKRQCNKCGYSNIAQIKTKWTETTICDQINSHDPQYKFIAMETRIDSARNNYTYVCLKCPIEDHPSYWVKWASFIQGRRCGKCSRNVVRTTQEFQIEINNLYSNEYKLLSEYTNSKGKIKFLHLPCGTAFEQSPDCMLVGHTCPTCSKQKARIHILLSQQEYTQRIFDAYGDKYLLISIYDGKDNPVTILHQECGKTFVTNAYTLNKGYKQCPHCKKYSVGEEEVKKFLDKNNIIYIQEYKFDDCKHKRKLKFDFYLSDLDICIEYNGEQHYKFKDFFGGEKGLIKQQYRDSIKRDYCKMKSIKLIEIPYTQLNSVEDILKKEVI